MGVIKLFVKKIKEINKDRLNALAKRIAEENNKSVSYVKFDMIKNFIRYGIGYTDYLKSDYINLSKEEKKTHVTTKTFYRLLNYLNKKEYRFAMNDKVIFNKIFKEYVKRDFIDLRVSSLEEFKKFIDKKAVIFSKRVADFGGHGVSKIILKEHKDIKKLYEEIKKRKEYLIEEEIIQHEILNKINPYAVNSFRIVTLVKDGKAYILGNALRINIDDAVAIGCDDAYMRLDEKGHISSRVLDDYANEYISHPLVNKPFKDLIIPYVKESFEMCKKAALEVPEIRYVGWDVAITNNGPVMLEGNEWPSYGLIQFNKFNDEKTGHLKTIKDILGDEINNIKL